MKRWMQKLISVLMIMTLILSFSVTAFAGDGEPEVQEPAKELTQEQQNELEAIRKKLEEEERLRKQQEEELRRQQEEAATKETPVKEAPLAKEAVPVEETAPAKETVPLQEPELEKDVSGQDVGEISVSDVTSGQPEKQPAVIEDDKGITVSNEGRIQKEESAENENKAKEEKPLDPETVEKQAEPVVEIKPEKIIQLTETEAVAKDSTDNKQSSPVKKTVAIVETVTEEDNAEEKADTSFQFAPKSMFLRDAPASLSIDRSALTVSSEPLVTSESIVECNDDETTDENSAAEKDSVTELRASEEKAGDTDYPIQKSAVRPAKAQAMSEEPESLDETTSVKSLAVDPTGKTETDADSAEPADAPAATFAESVAATDTSIKDGKTVIEVDGTKYSDKDVAYNGESDGEDEDGNPNPPVGIGWVADDGTLQLTNEDIKELTVKEGNLTIEAAGFNHINNLVTDSVVSIIGTGIMLLDKVDLKDSGEVKLTENKMYADTGVIGSVAVFLKDNKADKENTYRLINGGIPGILDETYTIPKGYNLVIPSGESLIMNSTVAAPKDDGKGFKYYSGGDAPSTLDNTTENSAALTIEKGASLTVENGASIQMISTKSVQDALEELNILTPEIVIENGGKLNQKGKLTGTGGLVVSEEDGFKTAQAINVGIPPMIAIEDTGSLYDELKKNHKTGDSVGFNDLKSAWESMYPDCTVEEDTVFLIKYKGEDGKWHSASITQKGGETIIVPSGADLWAPGQIGYPVTGLGLVKHQLEATGSGIIEGTNLSFPAGNSKTILPIAAETILWRVIVTENPKRGTWTLSVWYGDTQIFDLGMTTVRARFKFDKPDDWDTENIYVVFIDKDGKSLKAFPAKYDKVTEELVFDSSLVGEFVVVQYDYQGELYSKGFYDELAKLDEVRHLVDLHSGKKN